MTNPPASEAKPKFSLAKLYLPLLCLLCAAHVWNPLQRGDDFWAHAAVGRWIWENHSIPRETLFLWSAKQSWVAHSWLSQLTFYGLMQGAGEANGPLLSLLFTIFMVALTFALVWRIWATQSRVTSLMPFVFYLAIRCAESRYQARPELFTALFFVLLAAFLISWPQKTENRADKIKILGLVLLFVVWPNFHGAVVTGLLILIATALADAAQEKFSPQSRILLATAFFCGLATLLNPYGLGYIKALLQTQSLTFTVPVEWRAVWSQPVVSTDILTNIFLLTILALTAWLLNPQRRWAHLLWLVLMAYFFLTARRNVWLLSLTCLLVMAANAHVLETTKWWHEWQKRRLVANESVPPAPQQKARMGAIACLLLWSVLQITAIWPLKTTSANLPTGKTDFIEDNHIAGRMFNDITDSPYMEWRLSQKRPLFIDIIQAYPDSLTADFFDVMRASPDGITLLDKNNVGFISLSSPRQNEPMPPLLNYLLQNPRWALVYSHADGTVWVRRTPEYQYLWKNR